MLAFEAMHAYAPDSKVAAKIGYLLLSGHWVFGLSRLDGWFFPIPSMAGLCIEVVSQNLSDVVRFLSKAFWFGREITGVNEVR